MSVFPSYVFSQLLCWGYVQSSVAADRIQDIEVTNPSLLTFNNSNAGNDRSFLESEVRLSENQVIYLLFF